MKRTLMSLALMAALPVAAHAGERSYSFIEADLARTNVDADLAGFGSGDADFDGFNVRGSVNFGQTSYNLIAGYLSLNNDDFGVDVDLEQFQVGFGYHLTISDNTDLIAELSYLNSDASIDGFGGGDGDDYRISFGVRGNLGERVEGLIKANYTDGDVYDGEFSFTVGGQFRFNSTWGLVAEAEFGNTLFDEAGLTIDTTSYLLGLRASF